MLPLFKEGDEFILEKVTDFTFKVGEILVYSHDNEFVVHRLQKNLPNDEVLLWGDFNRRPDLVIPKTLIAARVTHFIRDGHSRSIDSFPLPLFGRLITIFSPFSHVINFYLVVIFRKICKLLCQKRV